MGCRRGTITDVRVDPIPTEMQSLGFPDEGTVGAGGEDEHGSGRGYWGAPAELLDQAQQQENSPGGTDGPGGRRC